MTTSHEQHIKLEVKGVVQGVGFRPFVYNTARNCMLKGDVSNNPNGVVINIAGSMRNINEFCSILKEKHPPLARIKSIRKLQIFQAGKYHNFTISKSCDADNKSALTPPDIALCQDCLNEMTSPANRRYQYPFINCVNCGPRFTIVKQIPYDRPLTSMACFTMCPACEAEYHDPLNRRFHAQPNACPKCGPQLSWHDADGPLFQKDIINQAVKAILNNKIIAIRGLGGFHLVADACSTEAINILRKRKNRPAKPLAIMVADINSLKDICHVSGIEEKLIKRPDRPILLLRAKTDKLPDNLAPGIDLLGIMLPYIPLHHLLLSHPHCPPALIMTSGNKQGEPICIDNSHAQKELRGIADFFLLHNREIITRVDDSIARVIGEKPQIIRRARGLVPETFDLPWDLPPILGCGANLKNTFCLAKGGRAFVSQHLGNLDNEKNLDFFLESLEHQQKLYSIKPRAVACDLHPDYLSSHIAKSLNLPLYKVQHHHAHALAVMAEHQLTKPCLAIILDGTGYGDDKTIWGGEILRVSPTSFQRLASLGQLPMPGGDLASYQPWRMAFSALYNYFGIKGISDKNLPDHLKWLKSDHKEMVRQMLNHNFNCPATSSCGRLFDAVAALAGIRLYSDYEAQSAMELESLARSHQTSKPQAMGPDPRMAAPIIWGKIPEIDINWILERVIQAMDEDKNNKRISHDFHLHLIASLVNMARLIKNDHSEIILAGGCMQNEFLLTGLSQALEKEGFRVYSGSSIPTNDGGISLGQVIYGGLLHVSGNTNAGH